MGHPRHPVPLSGQSIYRVEDGRGARLSGPHFVRALCALAESRGDRVLAGSPRARRRCRSSAGFAATARPGVQHATGPEAIRLGTSLGSSCVLEHRQAHLLAMRIQRAQRRTARFQYDSGKRVISPERGDERRFSPKGLPWFTSLWDVRLVERVRSAASGIRSTASIALPRSHGGSEVVASRSLIFRHRWLAAGLVLAVAVSMSACGGDDDNSSPATTSRSSTTTTSGVTMTSSAAADTPRPSRGRACHQRPRDGR